MCVCAPPSPPALARAAAAAAHTPPSPPRPRRPRARLRATQGGAVLYVGSSGTATFAPTLPANTFSGNTAPNNGYGNCRKSGGTITGSCG